MHYRADCYWRGDFKEALAKSHDQTVKAFNLLIKGQTLAAHEYPSTGLVALCKEKKVILAVVIVSTIPICPEYESSKKCP